MHKKMLIFTLDEQPLDRENMGLVKGDQDQAHVGCQIEFLQHSFTLITYKQLYDSWFIKHLVNLKGWISFKHPCALKNTRYFLKDRNFLSSVVHIG